MLCFLENLFAAIGLLALIGACGLLLLSLEQHSIPQHCDVRIQSASGVSCYMVRERKEYRK
jgi:hypothetical protein